MKDDKKNVGPAVCTARVSTELTQWPGVRTSTHEFVRGDLVLARHQPVHGALVLQEDLHPAGPEGFNSGGKSRVANVFARLLVKCRSLL